MIAASSPILLEQRDRPVRSCRCGPGLLIVGACVLLYRTVALLAGEARTVLKRWVVALTVIEMIVDVVAVVAAARWWRTRALDHARLPLRLGAVAAVVHAVRVLVFVLGRTGPWVDVDVRPEHRADHNQRWSWAQVVFAGVMSTLGIVGVVAVWRVRRRSS
ncbi:hypothetical protein [Ilumatobacter sp.]|uniref:hypothetical protein n=1 Tax=Ilumatobacter sp. TaxID=1967498 RepID=UPI003AF5CF88